MISSTGMLIIGIIIGSGLGVAIAAMCLSARQMNREREWPQPVGDASYKRECVVR